VGVTVLRGAFILFLAYTYWLDLSRDKVSSVGSDVLSPTYDIAKASGSVRACSMAVPAIHSCTGKMPRGTASCSITILAMHGDDLGGAG